MVFAAQAFLSARDSTRRGFEGHYFLPKNLILRIILARSVHLTFEILHNLHHFLQTHLSSFSFFKAIAIKQCKTKIILCNRSTTKNANLICEKRVGESFNNATLRMFRAPLAFHKQSLLHGHLYVVCKKHDFERKRKSNNNNNNNA